MAIWRLPYNLIVAWRLTVVQALRSFVTLRVTEQELAMTLLNVILSEVEASPQSRPATTRVDSV